MTERSDNGLTQQLSADDGTPHERLVYVLEAHSRRGGSDIARLRQFMRALLDGKWIILACIAIALAVAVVHQKQATRWYQADVELLPVESQAGSGLSAQVSGLTGMLGLKGLGGSGTAAESSAVLRSKDFATRFIDAEKIAPILESRMPRGLFGTGIMAGNARPELQDVTSYFINSVLSLSEDRRTGMVVLAILWVDPRLAANWANAMVQQLNEQLRAAALAEAQSNVQYLRQEMASASQVSMQQALAKLMQDQLEKELLARGNPQFAFKVIDRAHPPTGPVTPQLLRGLFMAFAWGIVLGFLIVLYRARTLFFAD